MGAQPKMTKVFNDGTTPLNQQRNLSLKMFLKGHSRQPMIFPSDRHGLLFQSNLIDANFANLVECLTHLACGKHFEWNESKVFLQECLVLATV